MNKLDALRYFCVASETLNFRETAVRLSVSPQVVSRTIAEHTITPLVPKFISNDMASELQATLSGQVCSQLLGMFCQPYLDSGELVELFPDIPKQPWQIYLYRPYQTVTPLRIVKVFELLKEILSKRLDF